MAGPQLAMAAAIAIAGGLIGTVIDK